MTYEKTYESYIYQKIDINFRAVKKFSKNVIPKNSSRIQLHNIILKILLFVVQLYKEF